MADRKPTVLNPAGYQENLQDTDNLIVEAAPTADNHAVNKSYADTEIADAGKWEESSGNLYPKNLSNNVGIGTDAPVDKLHISTSSNEKFLVTNSDFVQTTTGDSFDIGFGSATGNTYTDVRALSDGRVNWGDLVLQRGGGRVGIGTDSLYSKLTVRKQNGTAINLDINSTDTGSYSSIAWTTANLDLGDQPGAEIRGYRTAPGALGELAFHTRGQDNLSTERVRISDVGNVGIGTDTPKEKLHVKGSILSECVSYIPDQDGAYLIATGNGYNSGSLGWNETGFQHRLKADSDGVPRITIDTPTSGESFCVVNNGNVGIGTDSPDFALHVKAEGRSDAARIESDQPGRVTLSFRDSTTVQDPQIGSSGDELIARTGYAERVRIDSSGNVGIGTDSPQQKLDVDGDVKADNFIGDITGDVTGNVTGNADTATKLKTARNINGTSFDGTSAITTAKWGTARNLNGVSVDGSADKTLEPYVERDDSSNTARYLTFVDNNTAGYKRLNMDTNLNYNPSLNRLYTNISGDAGTIDGLDSTQFLRSDANDTATGKITFDAGIRLNDNDVAEFGSSADYKVAYDGSKAIHNVTSGDFYFQNNGTSRIFFDMSAGNILPTSDNTGYVGTSANTWNNGRFTNFTVDSVLTVRGAIDLADNDKIRFGSGDDTEMYYNGSHTYIDLKTTGNFYIRDGTTSRFYVTKSGNANLTGKLTVGNFDLESLPALP